MTPARGLIASKNWMTGLRRQSSWSSQNLTVYLLFYIIALACSCRALPAVTVKWAKTSPQIYERYKQYLYESQFHHHLIHQFLITLSFAVKYSFPSRNL